MSSTPKDSPNEDGCKPPRKRSKGACDICRRQKIKCDSSTSPDGRCTHCISFNLECTHHQPVKRRGPKHSYLSVLESRIKSLEGTLSKTDNSLSSFLRSPSSTSNNHPSPEVNDSPSSAKEENEDLSHVSLADQMKKLSLTTMQRFFGPSSGFSLVHSVHGIRKEVTGDDSRDPHSFKRSLWTQQSAPWEIETAQRERPSYMFPEQSLMVSLISLYFQRVNILFPILHAPTFWRNVTQGLHTERPDFGAVVLVVCALGSRYSDDKRVLSSPDQPMSAGWKWFEQVPLLRRSQFEPPTLYELQYYSLGAAYTIGTSSPGTTWYLIGLGIRTALDMGAHRRMPEGQHPTVEGELRKRAFWVLIMMDRIMCGLFVGRPFAIHEEDVDADLPIECDDEYWENADPDLTFKQPPDKPSYISFLVAFLDLCQILAIAVRKLFTISKLKPPTREMEHQAVAEIDSALNDWKSRLPQHLQWDSTRERGIFFEQSGFLRVYYHAVQIQTHRRFVHKSSPLSFSSLAMCTTAAKSCIHIVATLIASDASAIEFLFFTGFNAGCLLFSNIWAGKRAGAKIDLKKAMVDIEKLKAAFRSCEDRFLGAARFLDMLHGLSRGLEDNKSFAQEVAPVPSGHQQSEKSHRVQPAQPSSVFDRDPGYQRAISDMAHGQNQNMDPVYPILGQGAYGAPSHPQPATYLGRTTGQEFQPEYQAEGSSQIFDNVWLMSQGFMPLERWNNYASDIATLDMDMFVQSNPDIFM